jgi:hypothetical protein
MLSENKNQGIFDSLNPFHDSDADDGFNFGKYFELTYTQRLYGFAIFFVIGTILSLIGAFLLFTANIVGFAITYSLGSVSAVLATLFLFGPLKQIKGMFSSMHRGASVIVYFSLLILTLVIAFTLKNAPLCIILVIFQACAYVWYTITSFPGGQTACASICGSVVRV